MNKKIVILISGNGSNLQAFIDVQQNPDFQGSISAVISNKPDVFGLTRALNANIPAVTVDHLKYSNRDLFDQALADAIDCFTPDLVILAGFMRILTKNFVTQFRGRLLNIHPSLLPKYPGLHTHKKVLESNDQYHGSTVHFVTEELDGGPIISQTKTAIKQDDTEKELTTRIQSLEHKLYPQTVKLLLNNTVKLKKGDVYFEDKKLEKPVIF